MVAGGNHSGSRRILFNWSSVLHNVARVKEQGNNSVGDPFPYLTPYAGDGRKMLYHSSESSKDGTVLQLAETPGSL